MDADSYAPHEARYSRRNLWDGFRTLTSKSSDRTAERGDHVAANGSHPLVDPVGAGDDPVAFLGSRHKGEPIIGGDLQPPGGADLWVVGSSKDPFGDEEPEVERRVVK